MGNHDGRQPQLPADLQELVPQLVARHRVEGAERFVQQHHLGPRGQCAGKADALLLTARKLPRHPPAVLVRRQVDQPQQFIDPLLDALGRPVEQPRDHGDVLGHGHVREQAAPLKDVADAAPQLDGVHGADVPPVHLDSPRGRLDQPIDHLQRGGLAAARPAQQHEHLPGGDPQADLGNREVAGVVRFADLFQDDHRGISCRSFRVRASKTNLSKCWMPFSYWIMSLPWS